MSEPKYVRHPRSLFPAWLSRLTLQQQAVLMAAIRGQDGDRKYTKLKEIMWTLRASVMRAAHVGRMLKIGEEVPSFMTLKSFTDIGEWQRLVEQALDDEGDACVLHYFTHLMHAAQILAYKHPSPAFRMRWSICYQKMAHKLHLNCETEEQMDLRLGDWDRDSWPQLIGEDE